jgi:hypothetical protein
MKSRQLTLWLRPADTFSPPIRSTIFSLFAILLKQQDRKAQIRFPPQPRRSRLCIYTVEAYVSYRLALDDDRMPIEVGRICDG